MGDNGLEITSPHPNRRGVGISQCILHLEKSAKFWHYAVMKRNLQILQTYLESHLKVPVMCILQVSYSNINALFNEKHRLINIIRNSIFKFWKYQIRACETGKYWTKFCYWIMSQCTLDISKAWILFCEFSIFYILRNFIRTPFPSIFACLKFTSVVKDLL